MVLSKENPYHDESERLLIRHCSPVLFGSKPAALFIVKTEKCYFCLLDLINQIDNETSSIILRTTQNGILVFFYKPSILNGVIMEPDIQKLLHSFGYPFFNSLISYLGVLKTRILECQEFPHEIGFFLGYPSDDVLGFIAQKGKNYKYCGLWKVYGDITKAQNLFQQYEYCRQKTMMLHKT
jgi:hypothetical protein